MKTQPVFVRNFTLIRINKQKITGIHVWQQVGEWEADKTQSFESVDNFVDFLSANKTWNKIVKLDSDLLNIAERGIAS